MILRGWISKIASALNTWVPSSQALFENIEAERESLSEVCAQEEPLQRVASKLTVPISRQRATNPLVRRLIQLALILMTLYLVRRTYPKQWRAAHALLRTTAGQYSGTAVNGALWAVLFFKAGRIVRTIYTSKPWSGLWWCMLQGDPAVQDFKALPERVLDLAALYLARAVVFDGPRG